VGESNTPTKENAMEARINPLGTNVGPKFVKYLVSAHRALTESAHA
jgi:hypothetical protein